MILGSSWDEAGIILPCRFMVPFVFLHASLSGAGNMGAPLGLFDMGFEKSKGRSISVYLNAISSV
jgi:hypothetical protein